MLIYSFNLDLFNCAVICYLPYLLLEFLEYFFDKTSNKPKKKPTKNCGRWDWFYYLRLYCQWEMFFWHQNWWYNHMSMQGFVRAFLLIIALNYVFNVIYSSKSEVIMSFIQWMWPEINDNQKIPPKTLSLICRIKRLGSWL